MSENIKKKPDISVIIPVYNVEKYLKKCLESVVSQTFKNYEVVLVDDGSIDSSPEICDSYSDMYENISVVHKTNGGVSSARNEGINKSKGKYIAFIDSDDYVNNDWLETLYKYKDYDLVTSGYLPFDDVGNIYKKFESHFFGQYNISNNNRFLDICDLMFGKNLIQYHLGIKLFKKSIIEINHITFCETCENFAEDLTFILEYLLYCDTVYSVDYIGYNYYLREGSMMDTSKGKVKLNAMNECAKHVFINNSFFKTNRDFSILYWLIMYNQYQYLIIDKSKYSNIKPEFDKIKDKRFNKIQTRHIFFKYFKLKKMYGTTNANKILAVSSYFLHKNWNMFLIQNKLLYKILSLQNNKKS